MKMDLRKYLTRYLHGAFLFFVLLQLRNTASAALCDVRGGQNAVILDITESIGQDFSQTTLPEDLPVEGDTSTIELTISDAGASLFRLDGKRLKLTRPLDRDEESLSTIRFEIDCKEKSSTQMRSFPVIIRIADENDNTPSFIGTPYVVSLPENSRVGAPVFNNIRAEDIDAGVNGQVVYKLIHVSPTPPGGVNLFEIRLPHQGGVYLAGPLDYETSTSYKLTIEASDLAFRPYDRRNATTILTIHVLDVDDQDPVFKTASSTTPCNDTKLCVDSFEYHSTVVEGKVAGVLDIYPTRIYAEDPDLIGASVTYSFQTGKPASYTDYFEIDPRSAVVKQIKKVDRSFIKNFEIVIQGTEQTRRRGRTTVRLLIIVKGVDLTPPKIVAPSYSGIVQEASLPGTPVLRDDGSEEPFSLSVIDSDYGPGEALPNYVFELTTSDFRVTKEGTIVVANNNLDRDPPSLSLLSFQAIVREDRKGGAASAPLSITVALSDINDNAPRIPVYPTISISAGSERRLLLNIQAEDIDEGINSEVRYALTDDAEGRFSIDLVTGDIISERNLNAGEQFQITIQATDSGGLSGEGLLDVVVSKGPNTNGPVFHKSRYTAAISEDIPFGKTVATLKATDPEGDVPYFSIIEGKGTDVFDVDTLSGVLSVVAPLDREEMPQYEIMVKAEDSEGLSNTASVIIRVLDVNDDVPQFTDLPYSFRVNEGVPNALVGTIKAVDRDLDKAGRVSYAIFGEHLFTVNPSSGEIFTKVSLDYEKEQVHYVPVVAFDHGADPLSSTATVTVLVNDLNDEAPEFQKQVYNVTVPENTPIGSLVATVAADDPDTQPSITYTMVDGNSSLFKVAADTGRVTLVAPLDYEKQINHTLVISTEENIESGPLSRTVVQVNVKDINDESPILKTFQTVTMPQNAPVRSLLVTATATDADGTSPNNKVTYSLSGVVSSVYFDIDKEKGEIRLRKPLTDLDITEFLIKVTATDGGVPPHTDSTEFIILMLRGTQEGIEAPSLGAPLDGVGGHIPLASSPRFSKELLLKEVREDTESGTILVKVPMVNTTSAISCSILSGNVDDQFRVLVTREESCVVQMVKKLDFEKQELFALTLVLHPSSTSVRDVVDDDLLALSTAQVNISVIDINDNAPIFELDDLFTPLQLRKNEILDFVLQDSAPGTHVLQLKAFDRDAGGLTPVTYQLEPRSNRGNYFTVDERTNRIVTQRPLTNVPAELIPFNLTIMAMDREDIDGLKQFTTLNIIIPIVERSHQAVLLVDTPKNIVDTKIPDILEIISEVTGYTAQLEMVRQNRRVSAEEATQIWFHLLNPKSWTPVSPDALYKDQMKRKTIEWITTIDEINSARLVLPNQLTQRENEEAKHPLVVDEVEVTDDGVVKVGTAIDFGIAQYLLIVFACVIILFVFLAIIITCILWSRFSRLWKKADKTVLLLPPIVDRQGGSVLESISKEYEVQVLHMSIPLDDDSVQEYISSDSPQQYFLDNVSYISKAHTGQDDGTSSEGGSGSSGRVTPGVIGYDSPIGEFPGVLSTSSTNENVMFGRRTTLDPSPVETTTEL